METKIKAGLYLRVSTVHQDVASQRGPLLAMCAARGWEPTEYIDEGFSGSLETDKRPALKALMADAHQGKIRAVAVWSFDRLARSLRQLVTAVETFEALRVTFVSVREGVDTTTPNGRLVLGIFGSLAEFERSLIRERVLAGLANARAKGVKLGRKRPPVDMAAVRAAVAGGASFRALERQFGVARKTLVSLVRSPVMDGVV